MCEWKIHTHTKQADGNPAQICVTLIKHLRVPQPLLLHLQHHLAVFFSVFCLSSWRVSCEVLQLFSVCVSVWGFFFPPPADEPDESHLALINLPLSV